MSIVKQVIVIRKDLGMRRGKEIAQGSHASAMWLTSRLTNEYRDIFAISLAEAELKWVYGEYRKVVCQASSLLELQTLADNARAAGLQVHMVTDLGATEFHGVPTVTALAIGPDYAEKIDPITSDLKLY